MQATLTQYEKATSGLQELVLVVFSMKKLGLRNFFTDRGGVFFFGLHPPQGGGGQKR